VPGQAFADATDAVALGPAPLGDPHRGVWVDYLFLPDATSACEFSVNAIVNKERFHQN